MKLIFNKKYNEHKSRENSQETLNKRSIEKVKYI